MVHDVDLDTGLSAKECSGHFGDQLLARVVLGPERCRVNEALAREAIGMPGRMGKLVEKRAVVVLRRIELPDPGHADHVQRRRVVGAIAAVVDGRAVDVSGRDRLACLDRVPLGQGLDSGCLDAVALLNVEHCEVAQERNPVGDIAACVGLLDEFPENDGRSLLTLAD